MTDKSIRIRVNEEEHEWINELAVKHGNSVSQLIIKLLKEYSKREGIKIPHLKSRNYHWAAHFKNKKVSTSKQQRTATNVDTIKQQSAALMLIQKKNVPQQLSKKKDLEITVSHQKQGDDRQ